MNEGHFDELAKGFATNQLSRGRMLRMLVALTLGTVFGGGSLLVDSDEAAARRRCRPRCGPCERCVNGRCRSRRCTGCTSCDPGEDACIVPKPRPECPACREPICVGNDYVCSAEAAGTSCSPCGLCDGAGGCQQNVMCTGNTTCCPSINGGKEDCCTPDETCCNGTCCEPHQLCQNGQCMSVCEQGSKACRLPDGHSFCCPSHATCAPIGGSNPFCCTPNQDPKEHCEPIGFKPRVCCKYD
jgi:hypothetical protein